MRRQHNLAHPERLAATDWPSKPLHADRDQVYLDAPLAAYLPWHAALAEMLRIDLEAAA